MFGLKILASLSRPGFFSTNKPKTTLRALGQIRGFSTVETANEETMKEPPKDKKLSKAMKAYLERAKNYSEFLKKEEHDFNVGKRHLANMMGRDPETFTQGDINEAVEYLFPSGIYDPKARPFMKPPSLVFPPKKDAEFDETGRPFHYLFYTGKPNLYELFHEIVANIKKLDKYEDEMLKHPSKDEIVPLDLSGSDWLTKSEFEERLVEEIKDAEYKNILQALNSLLGHKYAFKVKDFLMSQRKPLMDTKMSFTSIEPLVGEDGRLFVTTKDCPRKSARADVTVTSPGTGVISINGKGIDYFHTMQARNQILFPLELSGMKDKVDIYATVHGGGETGQSGAVRWGISWGLRAFVSPEMVETMRLAGLLTRDFRRRERKKPGQMKARRKFTWKKR